MLTNVMLYWLTRTAGSSGRLYAIRRFAERGNNIVHWSEFDRGGHFPAMEEPDLLIADLRTFFRRFR